jgi:hypothetical protein
MARNYYKKSTNGEYVLGSVLSVQTQVVAGINYKINFASTRGNVSITMWVEPWESIYEVTSVNGKAVKANNQSPPTQGSNLQN